MYNLSKVEHTLGTDRVEITNVCQEIGEQRYRIQLKLKLHERDDKGAETNVLGVRQMGAKVERVRVPHANRLMTSTSLLPAVRYVPSIS
jgi:hypothetical protein